MIPMCPLVDESAKDVVADHSVWRTKEVVADFGIENRVSNNEQ